MDITTFLLGFCAGAIVAGVLNYINARAYRRALLLSARHQVAERLPDGKFYFLVDEETYCNSSLLGQHNAT